MNVTVNSSIKVHTMFLPIIYFAGYKYALCIHVLVLVFLAKKVVMAGLPSLSPSSEAIRFVPQQVYLLLGNSHLILSSMTIT